MSKGSKPRPRQVDKDKFDENWDRIFGKKSKCSSCDTCTTKDCVR